MRETYPRRYDVVRFRLRQNLCPQLSPYSCQPVLPCLKEEEDEEEGDVDD